MTPSEPLPGLAEVRAQLAEMLGQIDRHGPLPPPTRYAGEADDDPVPGAHWSVGVAGTPAWRHDDVEVIAALDDVGVVNPCVFLRGIDPSDVSDLFALSKPAALRLALALLAAYDMAGSPLIAQHCRPTEAP